jgi:hypothetical protein
MNIERAEVDYKTLVPVFKNRGLTGIKGWRYLPYIVEILALRKLNVKHRVIAEWLNHVVVCEVPLNNNSLSTYLCLWKKSNILDQVSEKDIDEACKKIQKESKNNSVSSSFPNSWAEVKATDSVENLEQSLGKKEKDLEFA